MNIPILIICYNNYKYVKNTLLQIAQINKKYYKNIQIINNSSTDLETINFLNNVDVKVINNSNNGPWITNKCNTNIYNILPEKYIVTDPDLKLNKNIPSNFIELMSDLSDKYKINKIGFALDISDHEKMYNISNYMEHIYKGNSIYTWEKPNWTNKIDNDEYEIYSAHIDTTFCLLNKKYIDNDKPIRIAGNFTAKHLPWYVNNEVYSMYENYLANTITTNISSISKIIIEYVEKKYLKINKNNELFLIENNTNNLNLNFWKYRYTIWEKESFKVMDEFLTKEKIFIDIGGWIGTSAMYGSRKSKYVYCIESDTYSFNSLKENMTINCIQNYTIINKVIDKSKRSDLSNETIKNIKEVDFIESISLNDILIYYNIDINEIGLIKVDINGEEENILNDLMDIKKRYNIKFYIRFYYSLWIDTNLDRFVFLTSKQKKTIKQNPFVSILF